MRQLPDHWFAPPPRWFRDNGCSGVPDGDRATRAICRLHDWRYFLGGAEPEKLRADRALRDALKTTGGGRAWLRAWTWYFGLRLLTLDCLGWFAWSRKKFHWGRERLGMSLPELHALWATLQAGAKPPASR